MITMAIGLGGGVFYWLSDYTLAFWVLVYAIIYGTLSLLHGENRTQAVYRKGSGLALVLLIPLAWHIGGLAGYL